MKSFFTRNFFTLLFIFSFFTSNAQVFPYTLVTETDTYADLSGATELTSVGDLWDDPEYIIPLGFNFEYFGQEYSSITFAGLGAILSFDDTSDSVDLLIPYIDDLMDIENANPAMQSTISHTTEGATGERVFKLEWKECGFFNEIENLGTANNMISLQLWLYETSNDIEIRFGPNNIPNPAVVQDFGAPFSGFMAGFTNDDNFKAFWHTSGDPTDPSVISIDTSTFYSYSLNGLNSSPADGQVYRFTNLPVSTTGISKNLDVKIYPSLVQNEFFVEVSQELLDEKTQVHIVNNLGQIIYNNPITNTKERLDASNFPIGIYYVHIINEDGRTTKKIIKN